MRFVGKFFLFRNQVHKFSYTKKKKTFGIFLLVHKVFYQAQILSNIIQNSTNFYDSNKFSQKSLCINVFNKLQIVTHNVSHLFQNIIQFRVEQVRKPPFFVDSKLPIGQRFATEWFFGIYYSDSVQWRLRVMAL